MEGGGGGGQGGGRGEEEEEAEEEDGKKKEKGATKFTANVLGGKKDQNTLRVKNNFFF